MNRSPQPGRLRNRRPVIAHAILCLAALLLESAARAHPARQPEIATRSGALRGAASSDGILAFKGIPYAAAPVGSLRWRPPRPVRPWRGVRDATRFGTPCLATPLPGRPATATEAEDCLTVNVWTTTPTYAAALAKPVRRARPVMVWIHGGGFQFGSSAQPGYDGAGLAKRGVVLVSFNYRLGVMGFMAHPALDREGPPSGDYGLQDQLAALRWVRANISAFGGDPANVTVFGESAGAHAVGMLMASPRAKGLFAKAIAESGAFWDGEHGSIATHREALARGEAFQRSMGARDLASLRAIPAERLNAAARWDFRLDPGIAAFSPSVDGYVLHDAPATVFARGDAANVPLLAGWNAREEAPLFQPRALAHQTPQIFMAGMERLFGGDRKEAAASLYPPADAASSAATLIGDLVISQQTWELLALHHRTRKSGVYAYQFSFTSPYSPIANHTAEVKYVFGNLAPASGGGPAPDDRDLSVSDMMMTFWTNFAFNGDPNGTGLPVWPAYSGPGSEVLAFTVGATGRAAESGTARFGFIGSYRKAGRLPERWRLLAP